MSDDWRGEHLIRSVRRNPAEGNGWNVHRDGGRKLLARARDKALGTAVCAVPGCGARLHKGNRAGVCRRHNHAEGYCGCPTCRAGTA